jgi:hypothetical protein
MDMEAAYEFSTVRPLIPFLPAPRHATHGGKAIRQSLSKRDHMVSSKSWQREPGRRSKMDLFRKTDELLFGGEKSRNRHAI